jgi:hypothetical protein
MLHEMDPSKVILQSMWPQGNILQKSTIGIDVIEKIPMDNVRGYASIFEPKILKGVLKEESDLFASVWTKQDVDT